MRQKASPIDTIIDSVGVFVESQYEDTDVSSEELILAKRRFKSALQYLIITTLEEYANEKKQIQSDASAQHNA